MRRWIPINAISVWPSSLLCGLLASGLWLNTAYAQVLDHTPAPAGTVLQSTPATETPPAVAQPAYQTPTTDNATQPQPVIPSAPPPSDTTVRNLEQHPVTLLDEKDISEKASLLNQVLVGSVVKVRSYPIDFPIILKLVEAQNLPIQQAQLGAKIDKNLYYRSLSDLLPDMVSTYNQSRFQGVVQVFGSQTIPVYQTRIVPQLTASWTIRPGGEDVFTALAARQRAKGAKFQLQDTLQEQLTQASNEYYDLLAAGIEVSNVKLSIGEAQSQVDLNNARLTAGIGTKLDLERAKVQLVQREQLLIVAENNLAQAQQTLLNRLNLDPDVELVPPQIVAQPRPLVPLTVNTEQLVAKAIANNPTLKITDTEIQALRNEGRAVLSRLVPSVTLQTYINGTGPEIDKLGLGRFGGFALQTTLGENLGTAIPLDYRTKRLQLRQQTVQRAQQVRDIQTLVINGFLDTRASAKAVLVAQEQFSVAKEAYRLAFGRFRAGLGINVDVLDAETTLNAARTTVVQSILSFNQAQVRLLRALGEISTDHLLNGIKPNAFAQTPAPSHP